MSQISSPHSIKETVLAKIKRGEVKMRPRWQFMLKLVLSLMGAVVLALAILYLVSFVFFALHQTGVWYAPTFGARGLYALLLGVPWVIVLVALVFILALEILVRRYAFAYRKPLLYSLFAIVLLVCAGGFVVARTPLHLGLLRRVEERKLPVAGPLYRGFGMPGFREVHPGVIASTTNHGFIIVNRKGEAIQVLMTTATRLPFGFDFAEGDEVVVFGQRDQDAVKAVGMREVDEDFLKGFLPHRGGPPRGMPPPWMHDQD